MRNNLLGYIHLKFQEIKNNKHARQKLLVINRTFKFFHNKLINSVLKFIYGEEDDEDDDENDEKDDKDATTKMVKRIKTTTKTKKRRIKTRRRRW